jgi:hypothetical protein
MTGRQGQKPFPFDMTWSRRGFLLEIAETIKNPVWAGEKNDGIGPH